MNQLTCSRLSVRRRTLSACGGPRTRPACVRAGSDTQGRRSSHRSRSPVDTRGGVIRPEDTKPNQWPATPRG